MAEVLSQNEIDQLFHAISSGETVIEDLAPANEQKVRVYDFSKANKFSKEQMRTLHIIYEGIARQLSTYFSGTLRTLGSAYLRPRFAGYVPFFEEGGVKTNAFLRGEGSAESLVDWFNAAFADALKNA